MVHNGEGKCRRRSLSNVEEKTISEDDNTGTKATTIQTQTNLFFCFESFKFCIIFFFTFFLFVFWLKLAEKWFIQLRSSSWDSSSSSSRVMHVPKASKTVPCCRSKFSQESEESHLRKEDSFKEKRKLFEILWLFFLICCRFLCPKSLVLSINMTSSFQWWIKLWIQIGHFQLRNTLLDPKVFGLFLTSLWWYFRFLFSLFLDQNLKTSIGYQMVRVHWLVIQWQNLRTKDMMKQSCSLYFRWHIWNLKTLETCKCHFQNFNVT